MENLLLWIGRVAGLAGILMCAVAAVARVTGNFWIGGFQTATLLQGGVAAMVAACLSYLVVLAERSR